MNMCMVFRILLPDFHQCYSALQSQETAAAFLGFVLEYYDLYRHTRFTFIVVDQHRRCREHVPVPIIIVRVYIEGYILTQAAL